MELFYQTDIFQRMAFIKVMGENGDSTVAAEWLKHKELV